MYIGSEERAQGHPDVSNSYPWRPLHSMPLDRPVVVDSVDHGMVVAFPSDAGLWFYWAGRRPHSLQGDVPALSIAWKFVLDRAVQVKIAEAFGVLIGAVLSGARQTNPYRDTDLTLGLRHTARILHTCLGGRIPDAAPTPSPKVPNLDRPYAHALSDYAGRIRVSHSAEYAIRAEVGEEVYVAYSEGGFLAVVTAQGEREGQVHTELMLKRRG